MHKLPRVFDTVLHVLLLKRRNISINIEINITYVNLGLLLLFLRNLGSIHGHFIRFCSSLLVRRLRLTSTTTFFVVNANILLELFTDTAAILNLFDLRSIIGSPGGMSTFRL